MYLESVNEGNNSNEKSSHMNQENVTEIEFSKTQ